MQETLKCRIGFYGVLGLNTKLLTTLKHGDGSGVHRGLFFSGNGYETLEGKRKMEEALSTAKSQRKAVFN